MLDVRLGFMYNILKKRADGFERLLGLTKDN